MSRVEEWLDENDEYFYFQQGYAHRLDVISILHLHNRE